MISPTILNRVIERWTIDGARPGAPCPQQEMKSFETKYSVVLPPDVRAYLCAANGMTGEAQSDQDREGFSFWALERWRPTVEEPGAVEGLLNDDPLRGLFTFADYMTWSWAYAVRLDSRQSDHGSVFLVGDGPPYVVAETFSEFFDKYVARSEVLLKR